VPTWCSPTSRTPWTGGVAIPEYPGDHFHSLFSKILMAGRANGLQAFDGPFLKIKEVDALRDYAM